MNNRIYTPGELLTIKTNLSEIERTLGHPIPGGLVDMDDLKDYILKPGEVLTVTHNLRRVSEMHHHHHRSYNYRRTNSNPISEAFILILIGLLALPILGIIELVHWISSIL